MIERDIERRLKRQIEALGSGILCLKFTSPGYVGVPDRIILLPGGRIVFAELKAPGKTERPRQVIVQRALRKLGFTVFSSVDSYEKVGEIVRYCRREVMS